MYRRRKVGFAHQKLVDTARRRPAFGDRPDHQRGAPVRVAADGHAGRVGLPVTAAQQRATAIGNELETREQRGVFDTLETDCKQCQFAG